MVDARLPDGSRVNVIIPPLSLTGPTLSIRKFGRTPIRRQDLVAYQSLTPAMLKFLQMAIQAKLNLLISGGTGAGKTTLLNVLSGFIPEAERIITIEDSAELRLNQPHVVSLESRPPNIEGVGQIRLSDLVKNSLRMRPDRIIVGEARGEEAMDMLQAMNTGHPGSMSTIHANSARDALSRMEVMVGHGLNSLFRAGHPRSDRQCGAHRGPALPAGRRQAQGGRHLRGFRHRKRHYLPGRHLHLPPEGVDEQGAVLGRFQSAGRPPRYADHLRSYGLVVDDALFDDTQEVN